MYRESFLPQYGERRADERRLISSALRREQRSLAPVTLARPEQPPSPANGSPARKAVEEGAIDVRDGGTAIADDKEDPFIRAEYEPTVKP
jgi:hypothetical protein